jgi:hypothetical protein
MQDGVSAEAASPATITPMTTTQNNTNITTGQGVVGPLAAAT